MSKLQERVITSNRFTAFATDQGAVGDGVAQDGAALNRLFDLAAQRGARQAFLPAGIYLLEQSLGGGSHLRITGAAHDELTAGQGTVIKLPASADFPAFYSASRRYWMVLENLTIDCNGASVDAVKMHLSHSILRRVRIINCVANGIYLCPTIISSEIGYLNHVELCEIEESDVGVTWDYTASDMWIGPGNNIGSTTANIRPGSQGAPVFIVNNWLNGSPVHNIHYPASGANIMIQDNVMENTSQENILIEEPSFISGDHNADVSILGNFIKNASRGNPNAYSAVKLTGYSSAKRLVGAKVVGNTFVTDVNTPKFGVEAVDVKNLAIVGNTFQAMGTGYYSVTGASTVRIESNMPENYAVATVSSSPYAVRLWDGILKVNATGASRQINLPPAAYFADRRLVIIKTDSSGNAVTAVPDGVEALNGTPSVNTQWARLDLYCDGTAWYSL